MLLIKFSSDCFCVIGLLSFFPLPRHRGVVVITAAQLHSIKSKLKFCARILRKSQLKPCSRLVKDLQW